MLIEISLYFQYVKSFSYITLIFYLVLVDPCQASLVDQLAKINNEKNSLYFFVTVKFVVQ